MTVHRIIRHVLSLISDCIVLLPSFISHAFWATDAHQIIVSVCVLLGLSDGHIGNCCFGWLIRILRVAWSFVWIWFVVLSNAGWCAIKFDISDATFFYFNCRVDVLRTNRRWTAMIRFIFTRSKSFFSLRLSNTNFPAIRAQNLSDGQPPRFSLSFESLRKCHLHSTILFLNRIILE